MVRIKQALFLYEARPNDLAFFISLKLLSVSKHKNAWLKKMQKVRIDILREWLSPLNQLAPIKPSQSASDIPELSLKLAIERPHQIITGWIRVVVSVLVTHGQP